MAASHNRDSQRLMCKGKFWVRWWEQNRNWEQHVGVLHGVFKGQTLCQGKFFETDHYEGYASGCLLPQLSTHPHDTLRGCPLCKGHLHPNYCLMRRTCDDTETTTSPIIIL